MRTDEKMRSALGFSMRSGNLLAGDFACENAVKKGKAKLVVLDESASANTKERYQGLCERAGIPCVLMESMGEAVGKPGRMIAAVTDVSFAKMVGDAYANMHGGND
ncbi:MAG TPA: L7Ae/L30e/S12e/Gadd45 family ribosomal protein [Clostridia bacterium]|nr:L7Ae/L30e/S12e/Gadd45 family ribosomal protein [Clostridia bacterium]